MARKRNSHNKRRANPDRSKKPEILKPEELSIKACTDAKKVPDSANSSNQFYLHKKFKRLVNTLEVSCEYSSNGVEVNAVEENKVPASSGDVPSSQTDRFIPKSVIENNCSVEKVDEINSVVRSDNDVADCLLDVENSDKCRKSGKHSCDYCGLVCAKPSVLEKHIRVHTNEKPYPCQLCNIAFKTRSNLYKHCKSQGHILKCELQNQVGPRPSSDMVTATPTCSQPAVDLYGDSSSPTSNSSQDLRQKPIYKPKFHLSDVDFKEDSPSTPPSVITPTTVSLHDALPCQSGLSKDCGQSSVFERKCNISPPGFSELKSLSVPSPVRPITPATPLSVKELKTASPEVIQRHISKIISENQAIVETFDTLWPRRVNRQNSPPEEEDDLRSNDTRKTSEGIKSASNGDDIHDCGVKAQERYSSKDVSDVTFDPKAKGVYLATRTADEMTKAPRVNGGFQAMYTPSDTDNNPRKRCISDGSLSIKDVWMAANSPSIKQLRYDETQVDYTAAKMNMIHPQNPEGSIIKDLLLKPRSGKQGESGGSESPSEYEAEGLKDRILLPDVVGGTFFCKSCKISYKNIESLHMHEQFHCDGGLRPPPVTSPEEVTPYSSVIPNCSDDNRMTHDKDPELKKHPSMSCDQIPPFKKRKLVDSCLTSVTDHSVAHLLSRHCKSLTDVSPASVVSFANIGPVSVVSNMYRPASFGDKLITQSTSSELSTHDKLIAHSPSLELPTRDKDDDNLHLIANVCSSEHGYLPLKASMTSVITFPHSVSLPDVCSPSIPRGSSCDSPKNYVDTTKALEAFNCASLVSNSAVRSTSSPIKSFKARQVPYVPGIPGPYSVSSQVDMCLTTPPVQLQSVHLEPVKVIKRVNHSVIPSITISSEVCNTDAKEYSSKETETDKATESKYLAPPRPTTLRLIPQIHLPKNKHLLMGTTLVSPETPRPRKSYSQIYFNGHAYTYLGLKCSTKVFFCCISHPQPMYVLQSTDPKLSMYSVWQTCPADPNPYGLTPGQSLALHNSSQRKNTYTIARPKEVQLSVTHSSYWKLKSEKELSSDSEDDEEATKEEELEKDKADSSTAEKPKRVKIFEGGFKSNEHYTYVRGRGRGRYVCEECGIRCKKPSMLKKHIRTHTDVRPYLCRHCSFSFKTKGNLTKHMKSKAHYRKCVELSIFPVPVAIDENQQIDKEALAQQERMNLEEGSNDNYTDSEGDEDDDESEDEEEYVETPGRQDGQFEDAASERSYANGYTIVNLSEKESEVARSLLHLSQQVVMTPGLRGVTTPTEEESFVTSVDRSQCESPIDLSVTKRPCEVVPVVKTGGAKDSATMVSMPSGVPGLLQSIYKTSYPLSAPQQDGGGSSPDPTSVQGKLYHTYLTEKAVADVRVKQQQCGKQYDDVESDFRVSIDPDATRTCKGDRSRSPLPVTESDRAIRLNTEPGSTPNMVVGNHGLEQQVSKSSSTTLRHQNKVNKNRCDDKKKDTEESAHYISSKECSDESPMKMFSDTNDADFMKSLAAIGSEKSVYKKLTEDGKCQCTVCDKVFQKPSQLRIHFNIHYIERPFRCESCGVSFRTKGHLQKHKRSVSHFNKVNMNMAFGIPTTDNPRPFKCTDCKIAFRIHGHLAKHLRSKMHIMRLECLGKLPFGTYAEMEKSGINLNEIDTTDCENSLESLQAMAQKFCLKDRYETWQFRERTLSGSSEEMNDLILSFNESDTERMEMHPSRHMNHVKAEPIEDNSNEASICRVSTPCQTKVS